MFVVFVLQRQQKTRPEEQLNSGLIPEHTNQALCSEPERESSENPNKTRRRRRADKQGERCGIKAFNDDKKWTRILS